MNQPKPCHFFAKGTCKSGNNCKFSHVIDLSNSNTNPGMTGGSGSGFNNNFNKNDNNPYNNGNHQNFKKPFNQGQGNNQNNQFNKPQNHGNNFNKPQYKSNQPKKNLCAFFNKPGGCKSGVNCNFLHNYHDTLHHVTRQEAHQTSIMGCCTTCKFIKQI